jgi:FecR protein
LVQTDAPESVWRGIEAELDGQRAPRLEAFSKRPWFDLREVGAFATAIVIVGLLSFLVYNGLFTGAGSRPAQIQVNMSSETQAPSVAVPETVVQPDAAAANSTAQPNPAGSDTVPTVGPEATFFSVETIAGSPKVGSSSGSKLAVGEYLETDADSRARIEVADIGKVEIAPNSRVKLVGTNEKQHRLSLERGGLHAKIAAPPRLFIVDTPSAAAVDLGCEYILEVDKAGNSKLTVTSGFVALERGGRESIVPGGASCLTMKGKGLGTPFSSVVKPEFERALRSFDFGNGGSRAVKEMVDRAEYYDMLTLWHLLSRVTSTDRAAVYDALAKFVTPPEGVTREGILSLNHAMLEHWRTSVENAWAR